MATVYLSYYDADNSSYSEVGSLTVANAVISAHHFGDVDGTDSAILYSFASGNTVIYNLDLANNTLVDSVNVATPLTSTGTSAASIALADGNIATAYTSTDGANVYISCTVDGLNATAVVHVADGNAEVVNGLTNALVYPVCLYETTAGNGHILASYQSENLRPVTVMANFYTSGASVVINGIVNAAAGHFPAGGATNINSTICVPFVHQSGGWYKSAPTDADYSSSQGLVVLFAGTGSYSENNQFTPIGVIDELPWIRKTAYVNHFSRPWFDTNSVYLAVPSGRKDTTGSSWSRDKGSGETAFNKYTVNFSNQSMLSQDVSGMIAIPGQAPRVYDGATMVPMGSPEYPEGATVAAGGAGANFANAGGAGTYYYTSVFSARDNAGRAIESAPAPSTEMTVTNASNTVIYTVPAPNLFIDSMPSGLGVFCDIYRTSESGNDFFKIATRKASYGQTFSFTDYGLESFTANSGLDVLISATALYTQNGTLENVRVPPHRVSCVHAGRYFFSPRYAEDSAIGYTKSITSGISIEYNDILMVQVSSVGGDCKSLLSHNEKLYIGKERAWMVAYGEPLNDTGSGQGLSSPRMLTQEAGVKSPTAAAEGAIGIVFINSVDGLIYLIDNSEQIQNIGAQVRHYCETYSYDNVWFAPQDSCVRISSATVGAPTLSWNYKYNRWSTFTGRYDDGIRAALSAPIGANGTYVDVVMDTNGNVYVQNDSATVESFDVNISTSWISLNDIAGYGKFYKWTLVGGKKKSTLKLDLRTAYDYEPYWTDVQSFSANALTNFAISDQYGTMASNTVVDQALKLEVDGSRHKTDAVRLCVSTNNGTARDDIEILGARLEIGVRPGSTKLGSGRTVS